MSILKTFSSLKQITSRFMRRLHEIFRAVRLPDPSANLASISSANLRRSRMSRWGTVRTTNGRKRSIRMARRLLERDYVKRFGTIFTEIRPHSSSMNSRISSKSSGVKRLSITWSRLSFNCRNTLTNNAAWPPTVLGDGTGRLARRHVALQSFQVQRRPRAATTHPLGDQQGINRAHPQTRRRRNKQLRD